MTPDEMKKRTKQHGLRLIRAVESLPNAFVARHVGGQLLRAGTSVGANYRAACRGRTQAEFIAKLGIVEEECDESIYWMDMLIEAGIMPKAKLAALMTEANETLSIVVASINTARGGARRSKTSERGNPQSAIERIRNPQSAIRNQVNPQSAMESPQAARL
jgi:four helix bundle protein